MDNPRDLGSPTPDCRWRQPTEAVDYSSLPHDDYLAADRRAALALADSEAAACRRPVVDWNHDLIGPTESWRQYLAFTDPEWDDEPTEYDVPGVAA